MYLWIKTGYWTIFMNKSGWIKIILALEKIWFKRLYWDKKMAYCSVPFPSTVPWQSCSWLWRCPRGRRRPRPRRRRCWTDGKGHDLPKGRPGRKWPLITAETVRKYSKCLAFKKVHYIQLSIYRGMKNTQMRFARFWPDLQNISKKKEVGQNSQ